MGNSILIGTFKYVPSLMKHVTLIRNVEHPKNDPSKY